MKDLLKKKINSAVAYGKAHPALVGYIAGATVASISAAIGIQLMLKHGPLVDMEATAERILDEGLKGMYWETSKGTMIAFLNETLEPPLTDFK